MKLFHNRRKNLIFFPGQYGARLQLWRKRNKPQGVRYIFQSETQGGSHAIFNHVGCIQNEIVSGCDLDMDVIIAKPIRKLAAYLFPAAQQQRNTHEILRRNALFFRQWGIL